MYKITWIDDAKQWKKQLENTYNHQMIERKRDQKPTDTDIEDQLGD